jgi:predicted adenylyl cyclase CyaB
MPTNIEIKARLRDPERQRALAAAIATSPVEIFDQVDTFFVVPAGRLKLRELGPDLGQLIHYIRSDISGPKESRYSISVTNAPAILRAVLTAALGVIGEVRKRRTVYHVGQTRIHIDEVERLGTFLELEVVLRPGQSPEQATTIARSLMRELEIAEADCVEGAYLDLLIQK